MYLLKYSVHATSVAVIMAVVQRCVFLLVFAVVEGQISVSCNIELWSLSSD